LSHIDLETYKKVLEKFEPEELDPEILEVLINNLAEWYADKKRRREVLEEDEFHKRYRYEVLQISALLDLFTSKNYRSALGTYFGYRSARKRLSQFKKSTVANQAPMSKVGLLQGVNRDRVSVQTTPMVVIKFRATKPTGRLDWEEVEVADRLFYGNKKEKIPDEIYWKAHQQALAAMNQRRVND